MVKWSVGGKWRRWLGDDVRYQLATLKDKGCSLYEQRGNKERKSSSLSRSGERTSQHGRWVMAELRDQTEWWLKIMK